MWGKSVLMKIQGPGLWIFVILENCLQHCILACRFLLILCDYTIACCLLLEVYKTLFMLSLTFGKFK